jgi:hypothetical protein
VHFVLLRFRQEFPKSAALREWCKLADERRDNRNGYRSQLQLTNLKGKDVFPRESPRRRPKFTKEDETTKNCWGQGAAGAKALLLPSSPVQPSANFRKHGPPKKKKPEEELRCAELPCTERLCSSLSLKKVSWDGSHFLLGGFDGRPIA